MVLVKILKRKDAASVVAAVALGLAVSNFLSTVSSELSARLSGTYEDVGVVTGWQVTYLQPLVWLVLQVVFLEILSWVVLMVREFVVSNRPR
jgi:hypothetical protein